MKSNKGQERQGVPLTNYATDTFFHSIGQFPYSSKRMLAVTMFFGFGFFVCFVLNRNPGVKKIHIYDTQLICNPGIQVPEIEIQKSVFN